jgi:uncharacterized protein YacL
MTVAVGGKNVSMGAIIAGIGGILAAVSALLAWYSFSIKGMGQDTSFDVKGMDSTWGVIALILGIVVVALVAAWIMGMKIPFLPILILVAGAAILVVLVLSYVTDIFAWTATFMGQTDTTEKGENMKKMIDDWNKQVADAKSLGLTGSAGFGIGFFGAALGGIAAVVGGGLALMKKSA